MRFGRLFSKLGWQEIARRGQGSGQGVRAIPFRSLWERVGWLRSASVRPPAVLGLDIGLTTIRLSAISHEADGKKLLEIRQIVTQDEPLHNLVPALGQVFQGRSFENTKVHTSISGASTLIRYITLPRMSEKELRSSLAFEAEKYIPYSINEVEFDCHLLGDIEDERGKKLTRGILAVCKKEAVRALYQGCHAVSAPLAIIDAAPLAIVNAFQYNHPEEASKVVALVHVGYNTSHLSVLCGGEPAFTREIAYGGADMTQAIAKTYELNHHEAEQKKLAFKWDTDQEMRPAIENSLGSLVQEIRLSFNYFESHIPGADAVEDLRLSGSSAQLDHFGEYLSEELNVPVSFWDPVRKLAVSEAIDAEKLNKLKPGLAVCIGLALR